jgi:hypothetical protein
VRIVFVAGFFDPVLKALQATFPDQLKAGGGIVWIRQAAIGRELNINEFKSRFFDKLAQGAKQVLILMAALRGREWAEETVKQIVAGAKDAYPEVEIELRTEKNAQAIDVVLREIGGFGLAKPPEISLEQIAAKLGNKKVLCVGLDGRPGFEQSLERAGFPREAFGMYFEELRVAGGKNSNLIELLDGKSKSFDHLLYAWGGLRTLPPSVKKNYCGQRCEAGSSFEAVLLFKRWILGE